MFAQFQTDALLKNGLVPYRVNSVVAILCPFTWQAADIRYEAIHAESHKAGTFVPQSRSDEKTLGKNDAAFLFSSLVPFYVRTALKLS